MMIECRPFPFKPTQNLFYYHYISPYVAIFRVLNVLRKVKLV